MPLHDYECSSCKKIFEEFCVIKDLNKEVKCSCGEVANRIVKGKLHNYIEFKPFTTDRATWDPVTINSKKELSELCKKEGLQNDYLEGSYKRYGEQKWV